MNDYLWDPSREPDPGVKDLEERLAPLRRQPPPLGELPDRSGGLPTQWKRIFVVAPLLLAACLLLAAGLSSIGRKNGWEVTWTGASERTSRLARGQWIETGAETARLAVGSIGTLRLEPGTRLRLVSDTPEDHRVALARGTVHARIWAPPRRFFVETPMTTAIDLGCAYTLSTDEAGNGSLRVTSGWVSFERRTPSGPDEVAVPAGASCRVSAVDGPGVPVWDDAPEAFREAHRRLDGSAGGGSDAAGLPSLLREARAKDGLTLLALAPRLSADERAAIYGRLAELSPAVARLPRAPFVAGEAGSLESLRSALDLPTP